ncbi:MAG: glycerol-3-phosphate 1-O-acyltransferase PlsY [Gammaproteobacteria bacterium]|nr:glycerol-3-phosphate 1-O-acyltransferase PlsY [Gammaproteobacteria bacterium]MBU1480444.1 glycerol-3-phosphate 1-O-acyltransferase PlsY [Gammaproteobacteria bacterium]
MTILIFVVCAYLIGSVSFAMLMSKAFGLADPRSYGSGNPGATNVLRSGRKAAAALTLIGDAAKGWLAVFLAIHFVPHDAPRLLIVALVALAVFLGHVFPVFLKFKGGKGVATALGVLLAINLWMGLFVMFTWLLVAVVFRYSSLAALVAAIAAPIFAMLVKQHGEHLRPELVLAIAIMSMLLIWRHKKNIQNLMTGKESKIGSKKEDAQSA